MAWRRRVAWRRWLARRRLGWWLARRWLARRRMGLGPGIRRGLRSGVCLGCRTRLGLGSGLGQSLLECGRTLRLGACSRLAIRASGGAFRLALLVIPA